VNVVPARELWNPADPAFKADPYPTYRRMRTQAPVLDVPGGPVVVTRYDDVSRLLRTNDVSRDIDEHLLIDESDPLARAPPRAPDGEDDPQPRPARSHPAAAARVEGVHADRRRAAPPADRGDGRRSCSTSPPSAARSS
jgi:cytochrome P450